MDCQSSPTKKVGRPWLFQGLGEVHLAIGDVLELVDQDVLERIVPSPLLDDPHSAVYQVVEGQRHLLLLKQLLIRFPNVSEYLKEALGPILVLLGVAPLQGLLVVQVSGLGMIQEGSLEGETGGTAVLGKSFLTSSSVGTGLNFTP